MDDIIFYVSLLTINGSSDDNKFSLINLQSLLFTKPSRQIVFMQTIETEELVASRASTEGERIANKTAFFN